MDNNYFRELNAINVNEKTEKKNGLTYLSWAWAWGEVKKLHPDATYTVYENADGWCYHTDGRTGWVKTGVTVKGIEHIEYLPIMDVRNRSIPLGNITSFDVNKAIQRSLTKAVARHGLGLYIYAGEDLPEGADGDEEPDKRQEVKETPEEEPKPKTKKEVKEPEHFICADCGNEIAPWVVNGKTKMPVRAIVTLSENKYGRRLCLDCGAKAKYRELRKDA